MTKPGIFFADKVETETRTRMNEISWRDFWVWFSASIVPKWYTQSHAGHGRVRFLPKCSTWTEHELEWLDDGNSNSKLARLWIFIVFI